jgi:hypothetical protein
MKDGWALVAGLATMATLWLVLFGVSTAGALGASHAAQSLAGAARSAAPSARPGRPGAVGKSKSKAVIVRCTERLGSGSGVPFDVADVLGPVLDLARSLHPCGTGPMAFDRGDAMWEQPVFTADGGSAVLLAWPSETRWVAAFVSSDDARGYRRLIAGGWRSLGKPVAYFACDGLWIQPFRSPSGTIAGIGIRARVDRPHRADEPIFVWGATAEMLLRKTPGRLAMPEGQADVSGLQEFRTLGAIRGTNEPAVRLTSMQLEASCAG